MLGCAPGGWLQVACQLLGPPARGGAVLGLDIQARPACTLIPANALLSGVR